LLGHKLLSNMIYLNYDLSIGRIFSGILIIISFFPYIQDIFKHKTNPQRASWLIWAILGAIAFFSQLAKGATHSLWFTGLQELATY